MITFFRLYSSAVFNDVFQEFSTPEIQQKPVDDLYLQMKCMNIDRIVNFPFPTAPDLLQLKTAEQRLEILGKNFFLAFFETISDVFNFVLFCSRIFRCPKKEPSHTIRPSHIKISSVATLRQNVSIKSSTRPVTVHHLPCCRFECTRSIIRSK